ncbi:MAG: ketoacyl-ACP synthase III [Bacteroidota bacterium]
MRNAHIISCGAYAPERVISNQFFNERLGEDVDTWLREKVHIYERRWCAADESTADLAENAARVTLERAGVSAEQLDLIIVSTDTPEFVSPSTASVVQHRLGATKAGTFDVNTACAGFVTALDIGSKYIRADEQYEYILVIGAYAMSKFLNMGDKKTVTLFADGAGAVLLKSEKDTDRGFLASQLISKGEYNSWMGVYGGGTKMPISDAVLDNHDHQLKFVHKFPKELNPQIWSEMAERLNERIGKTADDVARYFITQININAIWETLDRLDVDREKGHTVMHHYGYTGSACIPMAFNDAWEKELVKSGDLVYFIGSGGGLSFASAAFRL